MFGFLTINLSPEVKGAVTQNGEAVVGAKVKRTLIYNDKTYTATTVSQADGGFSFPAQDVSSVMKLLPAELVVTQKITINVDGKDYLAWETVKRDDNDGLVSKLAQLKCELSDESQAYEDERSVIVGICRW